MTTNQFILSFTRRLGLVVLIATLLMPGWVSAKSAEKKGIEQTYIVELLDPALPSYDGGLLSAPMSDGRSSLEATNPLLSGSKKVRVGAPSTKAYVRYLDERHEALEAEVVTMLSRQVRADRRFHYAINGVAMRMTAAEAAKLAESPMVRSIRPERIHKLLTDAGPEWIGADFIWNGQTGGNGSSEGEGIVVGVIDSGINWEHPSFSDPSPDGFNFTNPFGSELGLCSQSDVECNDKLVGIYDFVQDNPGTAEIEENTDGRDNSGHGSHVAGIAVGNRGSVQFDGSNTVTEVSGVAPRANLVTYRVCFTGDPDSGGPGSCQGAAIMDAIDQAIEDGVDVINYSIGTNAFNPWFNGQIPRAFLNARNAGIVVVTSAGNEGPNPGTLGSPANAPWMVSVGNASHNRILGNLVQNLSGGTATSPGDLAGASVTEGIGVRPIVHAADFGFPLCGTGTPELQPTCDGNTGSTNPWAGNPVFNGEIVVCDRGEYGRIEKGRNVQLAGAGGMILANTSAQGESIVADDHCLPTSHLGADAGDDLRRWLGFGTGHQGSISDSGLVESDDLGDRLATTSSRGPGESPVEDVLKPDVISPGIDVLSAWFEDQQLQFLGGTSMASPHVAGAAALLKELHPDWSTSQIISAIQTTATNEQARDELGNDATPHQVGGGRPQLGVAANAGLYLDVTTNDFLSANPQSGGDPKDLNLFGLVDSQCRGTCDFTRTVTDQGGGGNWQATAINFPGDVNVSVSPSSFNLANGGSQSLSIEADLRTSGLVGQWVYGNIMLSASGHPNQYLTVALFYEAGTLPDEWVINSDQNSGTTSLAFSQLAPMPDATYTSGGLMRPTITTQILEEDPTFDTPFDGEPGIFTVWHDVPEGGLWLHAETLASTSEDLDLFVGRDDNNNGIADESELICESITPDDLELCDLLTPTPGSYWIIVQNWTAGGSGLDEATLVSTVVSTDSSSDLVVTGPGIINDGAAFEVDLSWTNAYALADQKMYGAIGMGTDRNSPNNVGVIPVIFNRTGIAAPETLALMPGEQHMLALDGNSNHDRMYFDVPPGVSSLSVTVDGQDSGQNDNLEIDLYRQDFASALETPPFVQLPGGLSPLVSSSGGGGNGPFLEIVDSVEPGRYFLDVANTRSNDSAVTVEVSLQSDGSSLTPHRGLWDFERPISQGGEWNGVGDNNFLIWYAYDADGQPTWFIAVGSAPQGNFWVADLLRFTNDGSLQQATTVGRISITFLADNEAIMSYSLDGASGFDPMRPNGPNTCPNINGGPQSYTGHWFRGVDGLGGATVLNYAGAQAQVHYLYDGWGVPRWIIAADGENPSGTATDIPLLQFEGFCAVCSERDVSFDTVGLVTRNFTDETNGSWTLNFVLDSPLVQSIDRTDSIVKLSDTLICE